MFEEFREKGVVAIGFGDLGDLADTATREQILQRYKAAWPEANKFKAANVAGQLFRFVREIAVGDGVLTYDPARRVYLVGTIKGDCTYAKEIEGVPHVRRVEWQGEVARDNLTAPTRNSLGAIQTLIQLPPEAVQDIERAMHGKPKPVEDEAGDAEIAETFPHDDVEAKALEAIKDRVNKLDWEEMQDLVAGLLRALGYKTRVSPPGADRGKDIVASPDGFGFESPRIIVEVKHRAGAMGSQQIRSFLGGRHPGDKGLYVSTGGFTKDAYYEAERANIPLTLLNLDELVKALVESYEKLDIETQQLIPLRKVYVPA